MLKNRTIINLDYFSDNGITCERYWWSAYSSPQPKGLFTLEQKRKRFFSLIFVAATVTLM